MFKFIALFAIIASAFAKPGVIAPIAYSAPLVAAPGVVTATSSQVIARNYNGIAAAPVVAAAPLAYSAAYTSPVAYTAQVAYTAPVAYNAAVSPLKYTAAAPVFL